MISVSQDKGFTLLEVVIAIAILSLSLGALYPIFGTSYQRVDAVKTRAFGLTLTDAKLQAQLLAADWDALPVEGSENGWAWSVTGEVYSHDTDNDEDTDFLYLVTATATPPTAVAGNPVVLQRVVYRRR